MLTRFIPLAFVCLSAHGQDTPPAFEVASIKPATPLGPMGMRSDRTGGPGTPDPGMYTCRNCPIAWVFSEAYDVQPFQYKAPDVLNTARFDFLAKVPPGTSKATFRLMLQNLLVSRFQLTTRREKKEMPAYEMTVAKNGPRFKEAVPKEQAAPENGPVGPPQRDKDGFPILNGSMAVITASHARIRSDNQPLSWFTRMLTSQLQTPVVDATDLKANYDFEVSWAFSDPNNPDTADLLPYQQALIQAIQSQLGLKLESKKSLVDVLVVDHIEKAPTAN